uniref:YraN family protein n=1 Tax=Agathobacter sp. TaxID=2021311 RepID=UPI0040576D50
MNKRQVGTDYEKKAAVLLLEKGYQILERNYRNRTGEIDIIAKDGEYICFVEVKFRATGAFGSPLEAVDAKKQKQIRKVASYYLMRHGWDEWTPCRFDVIAYEGDEVVHLENAF